MEVSRRSLIFGACAGLCGTRYESAGRSQIPTSPELGGCGSLDKAARQALLQYAQSDKNNVVDNTIFNTSGDTRLDQAFGLMLADISGRLDVRPGFGFYDDSGAPNAWALPNNIFPLTSGTVLFGKSLLAKGLGSGKNGDMFIMSVCAHEFGHVVQYSNGFHNRLRDGKPNSSVLELHADFLAGCYLALRGTSYMPEQLISLGEAWEAIGDSQFTSPTHHGTPQQRIEAIQAGYRIAGEQPKFSVSELCEVGARYLHA